MNSGKKIAPFLTRPLTGIAPLPCAQTQRVLCGPAEGEIVIGGRYLHYVSNRLGATLSWTPSESRTFINVPIRGLCSPDNALYKF